VAAIKATLSRKLLMKVFQPKCKKEPLDRLAIPAKILYVVTRGLVGQGKFTQAGQGLNIGEMVKTPATIYFRRIFNHGG
jgi:hypothetical protein